jgi:hypothetical protein
MPIFTFACGCGFRKEVICAASERAEVREMCGNADCDHYGDVLTPEAVESGIGQRGSSYQPAAVMRDGSTVRAATGRSRRRIDL